MKTVLTFQTPWNSLRDNLRSQDNNLRTTDIEHVLLSEMFSLNICLYNIHIVMCNSLFL
jgi:hypothetical protein